jgi:hypothetical protein
MRVNVYAEEMTDRVEVVTKESGELFIGLRLYLKSVDNDFNALTLWSKNDLRPVLTKMLDALDDHYDGE